jgi:capsular exopolysaccharide synthesis family protein
MANQMPETAEEFIGLRQITRAIKRRRKIVIAISALIVIGTLGYLRTIPPIYEAVSVVRIQQTTPPLLLQLQPSPQPQLQSMDLRTAARLVITRLTIREAVQILRRKDKKDRVMERLVRMDNVRNISDDLAVEVILSSIQVKTVEPDLVEIHVTHSDPKIAAMIANSVAIAATQRSLREAQRDALRERLYIQQNLRKLGEQLKEIEKEIAQEKKRLGIVDLPEEVKMLLETIRNYESDYKNAQSQLEAARVQISRLQQQIKQIRPIVTVDVELLKEDPIFKQMSEQLAALEVERARLLALFTPEHPEVQQVEERIKALRQALTKQARQLVVKEREILPNPTYQLFAQQLMIAEADRFAAEARLRALNRFLPEIRKRLKTLPENQLRLGELTRKAQTTEQVFTNLLLRLEEARIREVTRVGSLTIADFATVPQRPIFPRRSFILAFALFLGVALGIFVALVVDRTSEAVTSAEEVKELLDVPVLASVPRIRDLTNANILDLMASRRFFAEIVRTLRANIDFLRRNKPLKVFLITSMAPIEGKTTIATSLAIAWAQAGYDTILVDFDLPRPSIHEFLNLSNEKGLTDLLTGTAGIDEIIQETSLKFLKVITIGSSFTNIILNNKQIEHILNNLRERAEIVIIDSAPIAGVSDTTLLIPRVDGVIAVVGLGEVTRPMLRELREQVRLAEGNLLGVVLNKVTPEHGSYYYYYRYYHRYYSQ